MRKDGELLTFGNDLVKGFDFVQVALGDQGVQILQCFAVFQEADQSSDLL